MDRFERAFALLDEHEGGYSNHPDDPGGATMRGVTQAVYNHYLRRKGRGIHSVQHITESEVREIYRRQYWDAVRADDLPEGVAYCVFDAAVNSGPARAARWLQSLIGAQVDGVIGLETIDKAATTPAVPLIDRYCDKRLAFMRSLRHWSTFKNGWTRRVHEVRTQAKEWAAGQVKTPGTPTSGKATGAQSFIAAILAFLKSIFGGKK